MSTGTLRRHRAIVEVDPKPVVPISIESPEPKVVKQPTVEGTRRYTKKTE